MKYNKEELHRHPLIVEPRKPKSGRIETIGRQADGGERRAQEEEREGGA